MDVVVRTADGKNLDLCIARHRAEKLPCAFGFADERKASLGSENAMNEIDIVCIRHGRRRYAAPIEMDDDLGGLRPRLQDHSRCSAAFGVPRNHCKSRVPTLAVM